MSFQKGSKALGEHAARLQPLPQTSHANTQRDGVKPELAGDFRERVSVEAHFPVAGGQVSRRAREPVAQTRGYVGRILMSRSQNKAKKSRAKK